MQDPRAIIAGIISGIALVGIIVLAGLGKLDTELLAALGGVTTTGLAFSVGLYSEPID